MENVHPSDFLRIMGGPAGRAIASDVDRACNVLLMMEIEDSEYALGEGWTPSLPIPTILSRIVRPSIYIVQQAVNPSFSVLEGHFHLPENTLRRLRSALRKILEVIHLISLQNPDYPSHVEIWNASSSVHLLPPDLPVSDRCRGGFQILDRLIRGEYPEYERSGRMMRRPTLIGCSHHRSSDYELSWHPDDSLYGSLVANICPSVFYIQMFVNPSFDAALPFAALSFEERISVRKAIRDVLAFLDVLLERHFPDTKSLDCRAAVPCVKVPSRSATMFLMLSLFMKEYSFEGDETNLPLPTAFLAARGAGTKIEYDHFRINGELAPGRRMALRFALLKDVCRPAIGSDRSRSQYEVFFVDFDTQEELVQYLCRPEVVNYCHNVLGPLRDVVSLIRDRFRVRLPLPKDAPWLRRHLANFLHHLGTVARAIGPDESVGRGKRIPTPSYTCLTYMARLIKKFGYDGNNIEHLEEHFRESLRIVRSTRTTRRWRCPLA
ncbi:hypothetical protein B0H13DRAFT_1923192 [Mycena leptocephala]|nr:hypothetical protein B0H13DRAFT_1923192 [Mycena leptocephala]